MLTRGQRISYGLARFGPSAMLDIIGISGFLFYYQFVNLPPIYTGLSIGLSYLVSAACDFGFGYISDRTPTRWGRRKPYVMFGAPFMALCFSMWFLPTMFVSQSDLIGLFIWSTFWVGLFKLFYSFTMTPFQCWMPEITEPAERPTVSAWQNGANFAATALALVGTFLLRALLPAGLISTPLVILLIVFMAVELIGFVAPLAKISGEGKFIRQPRFKRDVGFALRNRNYKWWILVQGILSISFVTISQVATSYVTGPYSVLQFGLSQLLIFIVEMLGVMYAFFYLWPKLIRKRGKRYTLTTSLLIGIVALPFILFVGQVPVFPLPTDVQAYIVMGLVLTSLAGYFLMPYIIYADFAHEDQIKTGEGRAGVYTGFSSIPLNIFQFLATLILGLLLSLPNVPGQNYSVGMLWWGPFCSLFMLLGVLVLRKTNIDPDFAAIEKEYGRKAKKE